MNQKEKSALEAGLEDFVYAANCPTNTAEERSGWETYIFGYIQAMELVGFSEEAINSIIEAAKTRADTRIAELIKQFKEAEAEGVLAEVDF